jgi:hypothetical protein
MCCRDIGWIALNGLLKIALRPAVPSIVLQYASFKQINDDISDARVYSGIHYRTDQVAGARLGKAVGRAIYKNNLRAGLDNDGDDNCDDD